MILILIIKEKYEKLMINHFVVFWYKIFKYVHTWFWGKILILNIGEEFFEPIFHMKHEFVWVKIKYISGDFCNYKIRLPTREKFVSATSIVCLIL